MKRHILDALLAARAARTPAALVTDTATGAQVLVTPDGDEGDLTLSPDERQAVRGRLNGETGGVLEPEPGAGCPAAVHRPFTRRPRGLWWWAPYTLPSIWCPWRR